MSNLPPSYADLQADVRRLALNNTQLTVSLYELKRKVVMFCERAIPSPHSKVRTIGFKAEMGAMIYEAQKPDPQMATREQLIAYGLPTA